jgi:hypothetical protein
MITLYTADRFLSNNFPAAQAISEDCSDSALHSLQAYFIIKRIHLMNSANADTLTPVLNTTLEAADTRGAPVRLHSVNPKQDLKDVLTDDRRM